MPFGKVWLGNTGSQPVNDGAAREATVCADAKADGG